MRRYPFWAYAWKVSAEEGCGVGEAGSKALVKPSVSLVVIVPSMSETTAWTPGGQTSRRKFAWEWSPLTSILTGYDPGPRAVVMPAGSSKKTRPPSSATPATVPWSPVDVDGVPSLTQPPAGASAAHEVRSHTSTRS